MERPHLLTLTVAAGGDTSERAPAGFPPAELDPVELDDLVAGLVVATTVSSPKDVPSRAASKAAVQPLMPDTSSKSHTRGRGRSDPPSG